MAGPNKQLVDYPKVAAEFDELKNAPITVEELTAGLARKFWWLCPEGHSYEASVFSRTNRGSGCPYCSGRTAIPGKNDLATVFPSLAKEWSPRNEQPAEKQLPFTVKKAWWIGECGHEFDLSIAGRTKSGQGCPYCSNRRVMAGFNDLVTKRPDVANEWHPTKNLQLPSEFTWGSNKKAWFQCARGHEWEAAIKARTSNGSGCPFCSVNSVIPGETDLVTTHPEISKTWDYNKNNVKPEDFSAGSVKKVWWLCDAGHSWKSAIYSRVTKGCPVCAGRVIVFGFNDLKSQQPELMKIWDYDENTADPSEVSMNSHHHFWWKCPAGHSFKSPVTGLKRGRGCAVCASRQVLPGFNDLATKYPALVPDWSPNNSKSPDEVTAFSASKVLWVCPLGHEYLATIGARSNGSGCSICDNKTVLVGYNDLASQRPDLAARWHPTKNSLGPNEVVLRSAKKVWWLCEEGHDWLSTPQNQSDGHDCPTCGRFGYRSSLPGMLYFLDNPLMGAAKVGITNVGTRNSRIEILRKFGFETVKTWVENDGQIIRELETQTLRYIRNDLGLPPYLGKADLGSTAGWKETFSREGITQLDLIHWIDRKLLSIKTNN